MPVLIDGNNLLHAAQKAEADSHLVGRSMLCDTLGRWVARRSVAVHVVFDGPAPPAPLAVQIGHPNIQVTYSGAGVSADSVVINILESHSAARRLTVVSTDREIVRVAKRRRATPMRSEEFWAALKRDNARPTPPAAEPEEKEAGLSPEATDQWLAEFGLDQPADRPEGVSGARARRDPPRNIGDGP